MIFCSTLPLPQHVVHRPGNGREFGGTLVAPNLFQQADHQGGWVSEGIPMGQPTDLHAGLLRAVRRGGLPVSAPIMAQHPVPGPIK